MKTLRILRILIGTLLALAAIGCFTLAYFIGLGTKLDILICVGLYLVGVDLICTLKGKPLIKLVKQLYNL